MATYLAPELSTLCGAIEKIDAEYKASGNADRGQQIAFLQSTLADAATKENARDILLGAWIFVHDSVGGTYRLPLFWSPNGSQLFQLSEKALGIDAESNKDKTEKNALDPQARVTYLAALLEHLDKSSKQYHAVKAMLKTAKAAAEPKLQELCMRLPTLESLRKDTQELQQKYLQRCAKDSIIYNMLSYTWLVGRSAHRFESVDLVSSLDERCSTLADETESKKEPLTPSREYFLRLGAVIKIMQEIEEEHARGYAMGFYSPTNSSLYRDLQSISNLPYGTSQLSFEMKEGDLSELDNMLCRDVRSREALEFWKKHNKTKEQLDKIKDDIIKLRAEMIKAKKGVLTNSPVFNRLANNFVEALTSTVVQSGMVVAAVELANFLVTTHLSWNLILTILSPQNAVALMGCVWVLKQFKSGIGSMLTDTFGPYISGVAKVPFKILPRPSFSAFDEDKAISDADKKLLMAVYNAPDDVTSEQEKERMNKLFNFDKQLVEKQTAARDAEWQVVAPTPA